MRKLLKTGDIIIIAGILLIAGILAVIPLLKKDSGTVAVIVEDGEVIKRIDLTEIKEPYEIPINGGSLLIGPGEISYVDANCPDHSCIKMGKLSKAGDIAACVPNKTCVYIEDINAGNAKNQGEGSIDAFTY